MKKYVKPELFYERFELSQHIASCLMPLNHNDVNDCEVREEVTGMAGFFTGNHCSTDIPENSFEDYCYTNGAEGFFGS